MLIPWGPCLITMQTHDPNKILQELIEAYLIQIKQSKDINPAAYAVAIIHGHSINDGINLDAAYL